MARDNVIKFEELLREDEALRAKLEAATAAYVGDKSDEKAVFEAVVAPLAADAGLPYTYEEGKEASFRRDLDEAELTPRYRVPRARLCLRLHRRRRGRRDQRIAAKPHAQRRGRAGWLVRPRLVSSSCVPQRRECLSPVADTGR